jgi:glycerophosphoryl diester phosphodiesterase
MQFLSNISIMVVRQMHKNQKIKIIGHRGAKGYEPENTLCSFKKAIELKADMIEFDVRALPTGEIVIIHDFAVNRTTNGTGRATNIPFCELRELDAGKGEKIPTLQEALDLISQKIPVYIELKGHNVAVKVAEILKGYIKKGRPKANILVASFNLKELQLFHKLMPEIKVLSLYYRGVGKYFGISGKIERIALLQRFNTRALILKARLKNEEFFIGTSNRQSQIQKFAAMGVDAIVTNYPDRARVALGINRI